MKTFTIDELKEQFRLFQGLADDTHSFELFMSQKEYVDAWVGCFLDFLDGHENPFGDEDAETSL